MYLCYQFLKMQAENSNLLIYKKGKSGRKSLLRYSFFSLSKFSAFSRYKINFLQTKGKKQVFLSFLNNHLSGIFLDMCSKKVKKKKTKTFFCPFLNILCFKTTSRIFTAQINENITDKLSKHCFSTLASLNIHNSCRTNL